MGYFKNMTLDSQVEKIISDAQWSKQVGYYDVSNEIDKRIRKEVYNDR